jgi:hypothetical protein
MIDTERDDPLVWLLLMERGRRTGDFRLAARPKQELERLGISVTYNQFRTRPRNATAGPCKAGRHE